MNNHVADGERIEDPKKQDNSIFKIIGILFTTMACAGILFIIGCTFMGAFIFGMENGNTELSNPTPEPTHSDSYYRLVEPTPKATHIPTPIPIPTAKLPYHAEGDPKKCGTCHTHPDTSYTIYPNPTPTRTQQYIPPSYVIPSNTNPIPSDYYSQNCELQTDQSMQEYLSNSEWLEDYDAGGWDCSQMAAYMEFMLENCGYHTIIAEAETDYSEYGHAWILVEFQQGWLAYECTGRYWVYPDESTARSYDPYGTVHWNPSFYTAGVQYEDIYDVWSDYKQYSNGEDVFLIEYGWWIE